MNYGVHCYDKETALIVLAFCQQQKDWWDVRYYPPQHPQYGSWNHSIYWQSEDPTLGLQGQHPVFDYLSNLARLNAEPNYCKKVYFKYGTEKTYHL